MTVKVVFTRHETRKISQSRYEDISGWLGWVVGGALQGSKAKWAKKAGWYFWFLQGYWLYIKQVAKHAASNNSRLALYWGFTRYTALGKWKMLGGLGAWPHS